MASLGARQRWKGRKEVQVEERERERETHRARKKGGAGGKRAGRHLCGVGGRGWPPPGAVPYQTEPWPGRDRCVARLITYLRLHYCKQCVSLCVRPLSLSLSSVDAIPSRLHRGWLSFDTASISQSNHHPHQGRLFLKPFEILLDSDLLTIFSFFIQAKCVGVVG